MVGLVYRVLSDSVNVKSRLDVSLSETVFLALCYSLQTSLVYLVVALAANRYARIIFEEKTFFAEQTGAGALVWTNHAVGNIPQTLVDRADCRCFNVVADTVK